MHVKIFTIAILLVFANGTYQNIHAQDIGAWTIYSSYSTVGSIDVGENDAIYASTLGGLFTIIEGKITKYTTAQGLTKLNATNALLDEVNNQLILGYSDGVIDILNLENKSVVPLSDIQRISQFTNKGINDMLLEGDQIYMATDFGVVVLSSANLLITNSFLQIGGFDRGTKVNAIELYNDTLYVATESGIAKASLNDNLLNSSSWITTHIDNQEGGTNADDIVVNGMKMYAIIGESLMSFKDQRWSITNLTNPANVVSLAKSKDKIFIGYSNKIVSIDNEGSTETVYSNPDLSIEDFVVKNDVLIIGTSQKGVLRVNISAENEEWYLPDGPYLNFFSELDFTDGVLIASATDEFPQTDPFNPYRGYYLFNGDQWASYNRNTNEVLASHSFSTAFTVNTGKNHYFIGSWGSGMAMQNKTSGEIEVFNNSNSGFSGIAANRNFVVIPGIDTDPNGNTWATSFISDFPLNVYSQSEQEWFHFGNPGISSSNLYFKLFADSYGNLWISLIDNTNKGRGLLVLKPGSNISSDVDDKFRVLTVDESYGNLPDLYVSSIIEDRNGEVWVGTKRGIARYIFPEFIAESTNQNDYKAQWLINEDTSAVSRYLLRDIEVSAMAINSANQKWVGSVNQGIWVINEDGSAILDRFTTSNSSLISNNIQSIAIDDETGEVYISTDQGLVSYTDISSKASENMQDLKVFPNPFVYDTHDEILIEGLTEQTLIKILGADGTVVHQFETRGGRVSWNGMDYLGKKLASGVYFLVAISESGSNKGIGKVVIIR